MSEVVRTNRRSNQAKGAAAGAVVGASTMPVRVRNNAGKHNFGSMSEGPHRVPMSDVQPIARTTGRRFQNTPYTANRAKQMREGNKKLATPLKLVVTGDGHAHQVDGAHSTWAHAMNRSSHMPVEVIHRPDAMRPTKRGFSMVEGEVRSIRQRRRLKNTMANSTPEKVDRQAAKMHPHTPLKNKAISGLRETTANFSGSEKFDAATKVGMATRKLRTKQGAYLAGGAAAGAGAVALAQRGAEHIKVKVKKNDALSAFGIDHGSAW